MNLEKDLERVKELLKEVKYLTFEQISSFLDWTEQDKKDYKAILSKYSSLCSISIRIPLSKFLNVSSLISTTLG